MSESANQRRFSIHVTGNRGSQLVRQNFLRIQQGKFKGIPILINNDAAPHGSVDMRLGVFVTNDNRYIMRNQLGVHPVHRSGGIDGEAGVSGFPRAKERNANPS